MKALRQFRGRPAVVMGGGPTLLDDLQRAPDGAFFVSCNWHAVGAGLPTDIIACRDLASVKKCLTYGPPVVSPYFGGLRVPLNHHDPEANTGIYAVKLAAMLAAPVIVVAGVDFYQRSGDLYFYKRGSVRAQNRTPSYARACAEQMKRAAGRAQLIWGGAF